MNTKLGKIDGVIFYDSEKELYNFPYVLEFTNEKIELDFVFHIDNYSNQQEMLIDRNNEISNCILQNYFLKQFERLQEICLDEAGSDELMNEINERLDILYYLFIIINTIHKDSISQKTKVETEIEGDDDIIETIWSIYDEILEMFILLEDLYIGIRKQEFLQRKKKYLELEKTE